MERKKFPRYVLRAKDAIVKELGERAFEVLYSQRERQTRLAVEGLLERGYSPRTDDPMLVQFTVEFCSGDIFQVAESVRSGRLTVK